MEQFHLKHVTNIKIALKYFRNETSQFSLVGMVLQINVETNGCVVRFQRTDGNRALTSAMHDKFSVSVVIVGQTRGCAS